MENKIDTFSQENVIKGYITGFFDGEGNINIHKNSHVIGIIIVNSNKDILNRIRMQLGNIGNIRKCPDANKKNGECCKQKWQFVMYSDDAIILMNYVKEYSIIKRKQIKLGIKYYNTKSDYSNHGPNEVMSNIELQKREWFYNEMKRLNHEKYDEKMLIDYDNEIKKLNISEDIRNGKQTSLMSLNDIYNYMEIKQDFNETQKNVTTKMPDDIFTGYCAGIFDAESCTHITNKYVLSVSIKNVNFECLQLLNKSFGGHIYEVLMSKKKNNDRQAWVFILNSTELIKFLTKIQPYVIEKQKQLDLALDYTKNIVNHKKKCKKLTADEVEIREKYRLKMMKLKEQNLENIETCDLDIIENKIINKNIRSLLDY